MPQSPDQAPEAVETTDIDIDAAVNAAMGLDIGTEADTQAGQPRDAQGRFIADQIAADAAVEPGDPAPEADASQEEAPDAESAETSTAEAGAPAADEKPKPLTQFVVRAEDDTVVEAPPLKFTFKAGGKEHVDVPLDKVVRLAQSGFAVERVMQEADEVRQRLPQIEQEREQVRQALEDQRILNARLLEDEEFFIQAREQYAATNTPEHKLARERQQLAAQREALESRELATEAQTFLANVTAPKIAALREQYPTVTEEEIVTRLMIELAPLQRNGRVPREQWSQVSQLLDTRVREYADAQHAVRDIPRVTAAATATKEVTKAREEATKSKRTLARAIAPGTSRAAVATPPRSIHTLEDAEQSIIDDVTAIIAGG